MTNNNHPITPPPELVQQWIDEENGVFAEHIATQAARWGADQELEACIGAVLSHPGFEQPELFVELLRATRRPKPPSLKEKASQIVDWLIEGGRVNDNDAIALRQLVESLPS